MADEIYAKLVKRAANAAIGVAVFLIVIKIFAWWKTGSMVILASMTDSLVDLLASITNVFVLRYSLLPADENHSFGHNKAECLAALAQSAFITGSAAFLLLQGVQRLSVTQAVAQTGLGIAVSVISIGVTGVLVLYQRSVVKRTNSPAIKADSLHYQTDLFMNIAILIALGLNLMGFIYADALFAIGIALYIFVNAIKMFWDAVQILLDQALPKEEIDQIWQIAQSHPRIIGIHDLKTRRAGAVRFIQLHLELDDHLPFFIAHEIADSLEQRLAEAFPNSEIIIHQEPTSVVKAEQHATRAQTEAECTL